jgi:hypothetical protein
MAYRLGFVGRGPVDRSGGWVYGPCGPGLREGGVKLGRQGAVRSAGDGRDPPGCMRARGRRASGKTAAAAEDMAGAGELAGRGRRGTGGEGKRLGGGGSGRGFHLWGRGGRRWSVAAARLDGKAARLHGLRQLLPGEGEDGRRRGFGRRTRAPWRSSACTCMRPKRR